MPMLEEQYQKELERIISLPQKRRSEKIEAIIFMLRVLSRKLDLDSGVTDTEQDGYEAILDSVLKA